MKKIIFIAVLAIASMMAYAQPRAIGGRVGGFEGLSYQHALGEKNMIELEFGIAVDGAFSFTEKAKMPVDLNKTVDVTMRSTYYAPSIQLACTYDWIDPFNKTIPWENKGEWHWYLGVGGTAGYGWGYGQASVSTSVNGKHSHNYGNIDGKYDWGYIAAAGRGGVEYDFWFPLQLSIDYRPALGVAFMDYGKTTKGAFYWQVFDIAVGVRYKF